MTDPIALLLPATAILTWALAVQLAIWWPHPLAAGSSRARAIHAVRYAAAGLTLGFLAWALLIYSVLDGELSPLVLGTIAFSTFFQTPLAASALAVARGERTLAIAGTLLSLLLVTLFFWYTFLAALQLLFSGMGLLAALVFAALVLGGGALAAVLELYVAVRQPRPRWDESHVDLL